MGKNPDIIYTDDEGALNKEATQKYLKDENIKHHQTRAHPNISERAIRTFKDMLYRRVEADEKKGKENIQWPDYILEIVLTYTNQMKHSATGFTPKEARRPSNQFKVKLNLTMKGKKNRVYLDLDVGDEVKIFRKRKPNEKERVSNWSQNIYTIEKLENKLGQDYCTVESIDRQYLRFELLNLRGLVELPKAQNLHTNSTLTAEQIPLGLLANSTLTAEQIPLGILTNSTLTAEQLPLGMFSRSAPTTPKNH